MKQHLKRIIPALILLIGIIAALLNFIAENSARISLQNEEYISELTKQRAASVDAELAENMTFIRSIAYLYGNSLKSPWADIAVIADYERNACFDMLRFVDASGDDYTSKGVQGNLADRDYFQAGMRGESGMTYVMKSRVTGQRQIGFYAPVYYQNEIIGVMVGFYGENYIRQKIEYELFGYAGEGWLIAGSGEVLGSTKEDMPENYYAYLRDEGLCAEEELNRLTEALRRGESTAFICQDGGVSVTCYAVCLAGSDWVLIRNFPAFASRQILTGAIREGQTLVLLLVLLFIAYTLFIALRTFWEKRRMREASRNASDISTGVSRLFDRFVTLDLAEGTYRYIEGDPLSRGLPTVGHYGDYCEAIFDRIPNERQRQEAADFFRVENLLSLLSDSESASIRVHAPVAGYEWFTFNFIVIDRDNGVPKRLLLVVQDVTELHRKEVREQERLQNALDTAERASRAKTEFLFNMSHDIRTPMNAIIGYTQLAQRPGVTAEQAQAYLQKIDSSSEHLLSLINDILEMSRIESGKLELEPVQTDLAHTVEDAWEMFAVQMREKKIRFTVDTSKVRDRWVLCDKNRLNRILLNLVSNAYKFTPEGGSVSVSLSQIGTEDADGIYELRVRDNGIGMSREFAEKLFMPFERERTSTVSGIQGTGLGMSITKSIVELMHGTIRVDTAQGVGTEFIVTLRFPLTEENTLPEATETAGEAVDFSQKRVLLAEDNMINREIAVMVLSEAGFLVDTAENGRIAVDKAAAAEPGYYDVILMDIQMPVMDGYTAAREIRALENPALASIPIIAMTANAFQEDVNTAMEAGMNGHIAKPLDMEKMLRTLSEVLRNAPANPAQGHGGDK